MRSRREVLGIALALLASMTLAATARAGDAKPTPAEIDRAIEAVKSDPRLAETATVRSLHWKDEQDAKPRRESNPGPGWMEWLGDLFSWIAQFSRLLLWLLIAAVAALLAVFIARMLGGARFGTRTAKFTAPTHVQDLDIRPESLPHDIGAAARALFDRGEHRAALALLYRGMLSRLAHVFEVGIRDSSTEGDCLTLAARKLDESRMLYVTKLVRTWQHAIYGGLMPDAATVHELCANFDDHLRAPPPPARPRGIFDREETA